MAESIFNFEIHVREWKTEIMTADILDLLFTEDGNHFDSAMVEICDGDILLLRTEITNGFLYSEKVGNLKTGVETFYGIILDDMEGTDIMTVAKSNIGKAIFIEDKDGTKNLMFTYKNLLYNIVI